MRNHHVIVQPRLCDGWMVTQMALGGWDHKVSLRLMLNPTGSGRATRLLYPHPFLDEARVCGLILAIQSMNLVKFIIMLLQRPPGTSVPMECSASRSSFLVGVRLGMRGIPRSTCRRLCVDDGVPHREDVFIGVPSCLYALEK